MRSSRKPVVLLPHRRRSGLFVRDGEYVADISPDTGGRTIRKLGADRKRALKLWDDLVAELEDRERDVDDPLLTTFLVDTFLPTQQHLKAFEFCRTGVRGVVRFVEASEPKLRIRAVRATPRRTTARLLRTRGPFSAHDQRLPTHRSSRKR